MSNHGLIFLGIISALRTFSLLIQQKWVGGPSVYIRPPLPKKELYRYHQRHSSALELMHAISQSTVAPDFISIRFSGNQMMNIISLLFFLLIKWHTEEKPTWRPEPCMVSVLAVNRLHYAHVSKPICITDHVSLHPPTPCLVTYPYTQATTRLHTLYTNFLTITTFITSIHSNLRGIL